MVRRSKAGTAPSALRELWAELKLLGERSGGTLVGAYVSAARTVLTQWERLEDLGAERRYAQRATPPKQARAGASAKQLPSVEGA
ncbi:MAG: hypothetical protein ABW252_21395 [Polyangiales bacterium]